MFVINFAKLQLHTLKDSYFTDYTAEPRT